MHFTGDIIFRGAKVTRMKRVRTVAIRIARDRLDMKFVVLQQREDDGRSLLAGSMHHDDDPLAVCHVFGGLSSNVG